MIALGVFAAFGLCLWFKGRGDLALRFAAFLMIGFAAYWFNPDQRPCDNRAWFCDLIPERGALAVLAEDAGPPPCPDVEPIHGRVFVSDAANAEVQKLMWSGVCQGDAIDKVASGWKAEFDPAYGSWWWRLMR
jgi:hypothetical protein